MKRARSVALAGMLAALVTGSVAFAYILAGWSILWRVGVVRHETQLQSLRIDGTAFFYGNAAREAAAALQIEPVERFRCINFELRGPISEG